MKDTVKMPLGKVIIDDTLKKYTGKETDLFIGSTQEKANEILTKSRETLEKFLKQK